MGMVDTRTGEILVGVVYEGFNQASICMHVAAKPGSLWATKEFLWTAFAYPFNQLQVRKVIGILSGANLPAVRLDLHLGFVHEATLKDAHPDGDLVILTMTREQCRWLNFEGNSHGKQQQEGLACAGA